MKSLLERLAGPWPDLVQMCLISCPWPALGEEEQQGVLFDQSSWGAQASLLSLLLISSQRTKKAGCSRRLSHRYLWEHPCQRCEAVRGGVRGRQQAEYWVPFVPKLPTFPVKVCQVWSLPRGSESSRDGWSCIRTAAKSNFCCQGFPL